MADAMTATSASPLTSNPFTAAPRPMPTFRSDAFTPSAPLGTQAPTARDVAAAAGGGAPAAPPQAGAPQAPAPAGPQAGPAAPKPGPAAPSGPAGAAPTGAAPTTGKPGSGDPSKDSATDDQTKYAQMQADRTKALANIQKIWADTMTAIQGTIDSETQSMIGAYEKMEAGFISMLEGN